MKLTDEQLMQLIWENQMRIMPKKIIHRYVNGGYSLCTDDQFWYSQSCAENVASRTRITKVIGKQHLLNRIRVLVSKECLWADHNPMKMVVFAIQNEQAEDAYNSCRRWWRRAGMPEGLDSDRKRMRTERFDNFVELVGECQKYMGERFPEYRQPEPAATDDGFIEIPAFLRRSGD